MTDLALRSGREIGMEIISIIGMVSVVTSKDWHQIGIDPDMAYKL